MDVMTTSGTTEVAHANTLRGEWSRFGRYLKRPVLPDMAPYPKVTSLIAIMRLLVLDFAIMGALLAIGGIVTALGIKIPETAIAGMELSPALILTAVVAAPIAEEIAFRSWLSGRLGHILALVAAGAVAFGVSVGFAARAADPAAAMQTALYYGAPAGLVAALIMLALMRGRPAMRWFQRIFPLFYWLSALAFASAHLFNFTGQNLLALLPLVLPQFSVGLILGYARVNYGLWSSMTIHLLHNAAFISMVVLASKFA